MLKELFCPALSEPAETRLALVAPACGNEVICQAHEGVNPQLRDSGNPVDGACEAGETRD
jgi:hypothetical protein